MLRPLVLQDLHQHQIQLVQERPLLARCIPCRLDNQRHDIVLDGLTLLPGKRIPARADELVHDLQRKVARVQVRRGLQNGIHPQPRVRVLLELRNQALRIRLLWAASKVERINCLVQKRNVQRRRKV